MIAEVFAAKIRERRPASALEQENVLAELLQLVVLSSLSRAGLFREALFHGGTCLRVVHGLDRFSEDLDFLLAGPDPRFGWARYLDAVVRDCAREGLGFEVIDKSEADPVVRKAFLKADSIGELLLFDLPFPRRRPRKIRIKLEVDTNPPAGSTAETRYITFPTVAPLTVQTLESSFATKSHALLCRGYVKGRDWYDFLWYVGRGVRPSLPLLAAALDQQGPWAGKGVRVTPAWYLDRMRKRVREIDWPEAADDVRRFLGPGQREGLVHWGSELFLSRVDELAATLSRAGGRARGAGPRR